MLSVLQYRKIGKEVARQVSAGVDGHTIAHRSVDSADADSDSPPGANDEDKANQPGQTDTKSASAAQDANKEAEDDDRIWVRLDDEENDPLNPKNWSLRSRTKNIAVLSLLIFVQAWAGGAESMANTKASAQFRVSKVAENLSTSMYLFGIGSGALLAGPLSETVGRNPTYLLSTFFFLFFVLGSAMAPNFAAQVVCRYLVGLASSATLSINGGSIHDQFRPVKRSWVFPLIAWANVTGKTFGFLSAPYQHFTVRMMLISRCSPCSSTYRRRLDRCTSQTALAVGGLDHSHHWRGRVAAGRLLAARDLPATPP